MLKRTFLEDIMQGKIILKTPKLKLPRLPKLKMPSSKVGTLLASLLVIAKIAKLPTVISAGIMLWFYAQKFGWKLAAISVFFLMAHEYGHLYAAKKVGIPTTNAIFIPFVGALIGFKKAPKNAKEEAFIAYMGPLVGALAVLITAVPMYFITHEEFWLVSMMMGTGLNLFNLIPVSPLDGGRIVSAVSIKFWAIGFLIIVAFAIIFKTFILFLVIFMAGLELYFLVMTRKKYKKAELNALKAKRHTKGYIRETKRITKKRFEQIEELEQRISGMSNEERFRNDLNRFREEYSNSTDYLDAHLNKIENFLSEVKGKRNYYNTDAKTKYQVALIYVALLGSLGSCFWYCITLL